MRAHVEIGGAVQGVGFRPFVYRLAKELGLKGWVNNSPQGVSIEVEGCHTDVEGFLRRVQSETPPHAQIDHLVSTSLLDAGFEEFIIKPSDNSGEKTTCVLPDLATCDDCVHEIFDPSNRRYRYPFTNCTHCGPRFSIITALPYDRPNTTMGSFQLCEACRTEYENPFDRRFHAQPIACPTCGPHLELWDERGDVIATHAEALQAAANAVRRGAIVALKGLGGFQLIVDARNDAAVQMLRLRKHRPDKPLALMFPSLAMARDYCHISEAEEKLITSSEAPIVLLQRRDGCAISPSVARDNPTLGGMLPYTPLHHLLMAELGFPIVATSGNRSDEPICVDEREALICLHGIADVFLVHNRPIAQRVDDSVARVTLGQSMLVRRARGYAPAPIHLRQGGATLLAVGAHQKNTIALAKDDNVFISQHIGDLETLASSEAFQQICEHFIKLYEAEPCAVVCDMHPDYRSAEFAEVYAQTHGHTLIHVQHHHAHIVSCRVDNALDPKARVLGVAWDGTGFGPDGSIWGGEFLLTHGSRFERVAHLRSFRLPGGEAASGEPYRSALGLLHAIGLTAPAHWQHTAAIWRMLTQRINSPITSSAGRLFDAIAALVGLSERTSFEGQAAMLLEHAIAGYCTEEAYPFDLNVDNVVDWEPMIRAVIADVANGVPVSHISAMVHNALAQMIISVAERVGERKVVISGGCFQNEYLLARVVAQLRAGGFDPYWHRRIPPNDGGIALGQAVIGRLKLQEEPVCALPFPAN